MEMKLTRITQSPVARGVHMLSHDAQSVSAAAAPRPGVGVAEGPPKPRFRGFQQPLTPAPGRQRFAGSFLCSLLGMTPHRPCGTLSAGGVAGRRRAGVSWGGVACGPQALVFCKTSRKINVRRGNARAIERCAQPPSAGLPLGCRSLKLRADLEMLHPVSEGLPLRPHGVFTVDPRAAVGTPHCAGPGVLVCLGSGGLPALQL